MLIRFGVANHKSIREPQEISFVASPLKGGTSQTFEAPGLKQRLLPAALIYGANASGKSNVLDALAAMRRHVVESFRKNEPNGRIARAPFALMEANDAPTTFEVDLLIAGVRYAYGFDVTDYAFTREWLHAYPHGHRQVWFEREAEGPMRFGKGLKGANRAIEGFLRPNALFLSTAAQHGHAGLMSIQQFFGRHLETDLTIAVDSSDLEPWLSAPVGEGLARFLRDADIGIERVYERKRPSRPGTVSRIVESALQSTTEEADFTHHGFVHRGAAGGAFELDIEEESRGTLRMGSLALKANDALVDGGLLVVDELDASLHTDLTLRLVSLFTDPQINTKGAQLLATTHDTNLLSSDVLRRDQIWFTEKNREGATTLYPLTDIRTRQEDNLERGYLQGRFGAIPYLGPLDRLFQTDEETAGG